MCNAAQKLVEPLLRKKVRRFEDCPNRQELDRDKSPLTRPELRELARFARGEKNNEKPTPEEISAFERELRGRRPHIG